MADNAADDREELARVSRQVAERLEARGIVLTGRETAIELADIEDLVEEFELEVESHGGDLMVDEGPHGVTTEPDSAEFVLPTRAHGESVALYVERLEQAIATAKKHRGKK